MRKRVQIALAVLLVAFIAVLGWRVVPEPEPVYHGRRLSSWLQGSDTHKINQAVRAIGTNSVPTLLRLLREKDSRLKLYLIGLARSQDLVAIRPVSAEHLNNMAAYAFGCLGHDADYAVPDLIDIYEKAVSPESRRCALVVLASLGPPAKKIVPSLRPLTTASQAQVREEAVWALAEIHCEPEMVVPVLMNALHDPSPIVQVWAVRGLGAFGPNARQAVPGLVELLSDNNIGFRDFLGAALRSIDPEAAAKAGMN